MKKLIIPLFACALFVSACQPKTSSTTKKATTTSSSSSSSSGVTLPTATPVETVGPTIAYRKMTGLKAQGTRQSGQVVWSSSTDTIWRQYTTQYFTTDSKLQIQFRPKASPGIVTSLGCTYVGSYDKLQAVVAVRATGSNTYSDTKVVEASVGGASEVVELIPPRNATSFAIDVYDLKWNYDCDVWYKNASATEKAAYCPYAYVWPYHCAQFDIYMSTDETVDIE